MGLMAWSTTVGTSTFPRSTTYMLCRHDSHDSHHRNHEQGICHSDSTFAKPDPYPCGFPIQLHLSTTEQRTSLVRRLTQTKDGGAHPCSSRVKCTTSTTQRCFSPAKTNNNLAGFWAVKRRNWLTEQAVIPLTGQALSVNPRGYIGEYGPTRIWPITIPGWFLQWESMAITPIPPNVD
jgi:hypothetical protein